MPTDKKSIGRPTVMNNTIVAKLIEAFKLDVTVEEACLYAGISKDTYYRKVKEDKEFSYEIERAKMYACMIARQVVLRQIEIEKDGELALKYLERKRKAEFSPRSEYNVSGSSITEMLEKYQSSAKSVDWEHPNLDAINSH